MAAFLDLYGDDEHDQLVRDNINDEFRKRYRFSRDTFKFIADLLRDALKRPTHRHGALSVELQLAIALRYYATGSFQLTVGDTLDISQSAVFKCIDSVSKVIDEELFDQFVYFPTDPISIRKIKAGFF